ncbi:hypothetical protein HII36_32755 [Nonomuraea sp. NN258]|uniref:hypothetical protein n=1 Tax=Nonomuraea antri TaxID=2730852 RepID=UPI001569D6E5|nr:hypothetical protein [Nonomuraea antri]NRQ36569.1 hypothetical protein [Nonomuraea antri]
MRRTPVYALAVGVPLVIVTAAVTLVAASGERPAGPRPPAAAPPAAAGPAPDGEVVLGDGRDRTASVTASDWATYADHVVVVTVVGESKRSPSRTEVERREGMIGRTVSLRVDKVLWSAPDTPQPAPATLLESVPGWVFNDNDGRGTRKFAIKNSSRVEVGHTYVKALEWEDDVCSDDPAKGRWEGLGSGGVIPFDGGVLGVGEFEGRPRTLAEARASLRGVDPVLRGVREQTLGAPVSTLVEQVRVAAPRAELEHGPGECNPNDK